MLRLCYDARALFQVGSIMTPKKPKPGSIRERNYQLILAAAEQEFVLHGFKGTSMQAIADRAGVPKANIHYYFGNKATLYRKLLESIVNVWLGIIDDMNADSDPREVLEHFIRTKVRMSYSHPTASRIFAMEIIQGAPFLKDYLSGYLRNWVKEKTAIMNGWMAAGKMPATAPVQLIFMIWATTQHYADFETQILEVTNKREFDADDIRHTEDFLVGTILRGIGLAI